jgi:hypothetical protein
MVLVALAMFAALCGTASADVFDDNPAVVSLGPGNVELFARGPDGRILHRSLNAGAWSDWRAVDGLDAGSGPAAVVFGTNLYLFARRESDGALWQNVLQGGAWTGWVSLGGGLSSAPAAGLRRGGGIIDVFVRGTDNGLYHRALVPGQGWNPWEGMGGNLTSAPAAIGYSSTGAMDVFVRDAAGGLAWRGLSATGAHNAAWETYGGAIAGAPTASTPADDLLNVYVRGNGNDRLWHRRHTPNPDPAGIYRLVDETKLNSSPAAVSDQPGHEYVFARIGSDLHVRSITAANSTAPSWGSWTSMGPVALPTPPAPPPPPPAPVPLQTLTPRLTWSHKVSRRSTKLSGLKLSRIPSGATVRITCSKGCSAKRWTTRPKKSALSLARFTRRPIRVGRSIRVQVTKPGTIGSVKTLRIRSRKVPTVLDRCLPPGASASQRCAT